MGKKENAEAIKKELETEYERKITVRTGSSLNCSYDIGEKIKTADFACYLSIDRKIAVIWSIYKRRNNNDRAHCLSISTKNLMGIETLGKKIKCVYIMKNKLPPEKAIIMSYETLGENILNLYDLLEDDPADDNYPDELGDVESRGRHSTSSWNRLQKFREEVLALYEYQCAICRCHEEKILEAAHIRAVADGGTDDPENGICLCANHHKMFDTGKIKIDFDSRTLLYVADSVKNMAWYSEFKEKYGGQILDRRDR